MFLRGSHSLSAIEGRESLEDSYPNFEIENEASDLKQDRRKMAKNGKSEKESVKNEEDTSELETEDITEEEDAVDTETVVQRERTIEEGSSLDDIGTGEKKDILVQSEDENFEPTNVETLDLDEDDIGKDDKSNTNEPAEPDQSSVPGKDTSNDLKAVVESTAKASDEAIDDDEGTTGDPETTESIYDSENKIDNGPGKVFEVKNVEDGSSLVQDRVDDGNEDENADKEKDETYSDRVPTTATTSATTTVTTRSEEASDGVAGNALELDEDSSMATTSPNNLENSYNHDSEVVSGLVEETLVPTTATTSETTTETTTATTTVTTRSEEASDGVAGNTLELDEEPSMATTLPTSLENSYNHDSEDVSALIEETLVPTTSSTSLFSEIELKQHTMVPSSGSSNFNNAFGQGDYAQDFDKYATTIHSVETAENENITDDDSDWMLDDGNDFGGPLFLAFILAIGGLLFFWRKRSNPNGVQGEYHPVPTMAGRSKLHTR